MVPSIRTSVLLGGLQTSFHYSARSTTSLFFSSTKRRYFGQLVSSDFEFLSGMNEPSCPCCFFMGKNVFLPWDDTNNVGVECMKVADEISLTLAADVLSPSEAWDAIKSARADTDQQQQPIALVDTHGHPHLERKIEYASQDIDKKISLHNDETNVVVSITCAVSPLDWTDTFKYACRSEHVLPALGIHPWYLGDILIDDILESNNQNTNEEPVNIEQYLKWDWLSELETKLSEHPNLIVGEIGLCKMARFVREFPKALGGKATALQLQKIVFKRQMKLAAKWRRPVTVHCVNAHGLLMETLEEILNEAVESCSSDGRLEDDGAKTVRAEAFPTAIAMHSFTGTAHHVKEILGFERKIFHPDQIELRGKKQRRKKQQQKVEEEECDYDNLFYFGFSHSVNYVMCTSEKAKRKGVEAVKAIPGNRLLIESDVHASDDVILGTAGAAAYAANARGESLEYVAETSTKNGLRFIHSLRLS